MNILFMGLNRADMVCLNCFHYLERATLKHATCEWAGYGWPKYKLEPLDKTVKRVMPNADWVIFYDFEIRSKKLNLNIPQCKDRSYKVATTLSDIHRDPHGYIATLNQEKWDAILMLYTQVAAHLIDKKEQKRRGTKRKVEALPDFNIYEKGLQAPIFHLAPSIEPTMFNSPHQERDIDALFLGNATDYVYPLRHKIYNSLTRIGIAKGWKAVSRWPPRGRSFTRKISQLTKAGKIVGETYASHLSRAKCFLFDTGLMRYPLLKFFEGMVSGTCVLSDTPLTANELHLKPGENYVEINDNNWVNELTYYLENEEERQRIALEGYHMTMKHHTNDVRAQQLINFLVANK